MMTNSYHDALTKLIDAQTALDAQDISTLPTAQGASLESAKAGIYGEIQALQAQEISNRDEEYQTATAAFRDCRSDLQSLSNWVENKRKTDTDIFSVLYKGVGIALSLLL